MGEPTCREIHALRHPISAQFRIATQAVHSTCRRMGLRSVNSQFRWGSLATFGALGLLAFSLLGMVMTHAGIATAASILLILVIIMPGELENPSWLTDRSSNAEIGRGILAAFGVLAILIMGLNFLVNPLGLYPKTKLSRDIVLHSRKDKIDLYRAMSPRPSFLVLGSSRSFTLPSETVTQVVGRRAYNASVQGATPRDYLAFLRYTVSLGTPPKVILVNLSVEQFLFGQDEAPIEPGDPLGPYLGGPAPALRSDAVATDLLLSNEQLEATFRAISTDLSGDQVPYFSFDRDGTGHFNQNPPLNQAIREYLAGPWAPNIFDVQSLSKTEIGYFRSFLQLAQDQDIYVIVFLPPFQPYAREVYSQSPSFTSRQNEMMALLGTLQAEFKFPIFDFRDISSFSGSPEMFHDAVHPLGQAYRLMLHKALGGEDVSSP